jgi:hypothetical protein
LQARLDAQQVQLDALQAAITQLQEQLAAARKDSSTSSKPPSSDTSLDDVVRGHFARRLTGNPRIAAIVWVNPRCGEEKTIDWL